jgi:signal transduction histidine kinase
MEVRQDREHGAAIHVTEASGTGSFEQQMEHVPAAFAITRGPEHTIAWANAAFRRLTSPAGEGAVGYPIVGAIVGRDSAALATALDRAWRTGTVVRDQRIEPEVEGALAWYCTAWPHTDVANRPDHLIIELRVATAAELTLATQRQVAERMLLSALREHDLANSAEASTQRASFLAAEGRRLAESLDEPTTLDAITRLSLPALGAWCIVDLIDLDGTMRRLAIIHPDPAKQALLRKVEGRWAPGRDDPFGAPAAIRNARSTMVSRDLDATLARAAHDPETLRILRAVGIGPLLTVPLVIRDRLAGAVTFVGSASDRIYTVDDVTLAEDLVSRSALALDSARLHGEAIALRVAAESASQAKSAFLGTMSHELRTPLNAIGGYLELIDMGLRGPVTAAQRADLARIRHNQQHLITLITDVLNLVRVGSGRMLYDIVDVDVRDLLAGGISLVEPLITDKDLSLDGISCDAGVVARADPDKMAQIIVNLLSNAIKFTPSGGRIAVDCEASGDTVLVRVSDTGVGIPADKLEPIFEPFVQARAGLAGRDQGVGLGLAISRDLARGMRGDLRVDSVEGKGATFTLTLPRAAAAAGGATGNG